MYLHGFTSMKAVLLERGVHVNTDSVGRVRRKGVLYKAL